MAAGQLSADQQRYVSSVTQSTGLDPSVVTAWVGAESGWDVSKATHNYLNIGPGYSYGSVDQAAGAASGLINTSSHYGGIRAAIPVGPTAQIKAIGASPWGTIASSLSAAYSSLASVHIPGTNLNVPNPGDAANLIGGAASSAVGAVVSKAGEILLSLIFVTAAIVAIGWGIAKVSAKPIKKTVEDVQGVAQTAGPLMAAV